MAVIAICMALVVMGVAIVARWGGAPAVTSGGGRQSPRSLPAWLVRYAGGALAAGLVAGLLAAGAGGRLVMRLLALTSPEAEGSFTEAAEVVGEITFGGTLGFILFVGVPAGLLSGALYALLRPVLPRGRAGGVVLGGLLLVLAGTRIEPLRSDNIDFSLVGPAWLAVLGFTAVALLQGMLVVALSTRFAVPEPSSARISDGALTAGRIAVVALLLVALPGFIGAVDDILSSA